MQALEKTGSVLGGSPLRVLPSKTAIMPVNRELMPRSNDEIERCSRTVYAANIDKKVDRNDVRAFFESLCGKHRPPRRPRRAWLAVMLMKRARSLGFRPQHIQACLWPHLFCACLRAAGKVARIRLLGDYAHATRIAFVEFIEAEGALAALNCSGALLGESFPLIG